MQLKKQLYSGDVQNNSIGTGCWTVKHAGLLVRSRKSGHHMVTQSQTCQLKSAAISVHAHNYSSNPQRQPCKRQHHSHKEPTCGAGRSRSWGVRRPVA
jgi:hypothetical protein